MYTNVLRCMYLQMNDTQFQSFVDVPIQTKFMNVAREYRRRALQVIPHKDILYFISLIHFFVFNVSLAHRFFFFFLHDYAILIFFLFLSLFLSVSLSLCLSVSVSVSLSLTLSLLTLSLSLHPSMKPDRVIIPYINKSLNLAITVVRVSEKQLWILG